MTALAGLPRARPVNRRFVLLSHNNRPHGNTSLLALFWTQTSSCCLFSICSSNGSWSTLTVVYILLHQTHKRSRCGSAGHDNSCQHLLVSDRSVYDLLNTFMQTYINKSMIVNNHFIFTLQQTLQFSHVFMCTKYCVFVFLIHLLLTY